MISPLGPQDSDVWTEKEQQHLYSHIWPTRVVQGVHSDNRFQGWNTVVAACSGTGQSVTSVASECDPSSAVYRSASRNSWTGVICNPAGEVVCLHLAGLGLRGAASSLGVLRDLHGLQYLNLEGNRIYGSLSPPRHYLGPGLHWWLRSTMCPPQS